MAKPALNTVVSDWQQRAQYYRALGIPDSSWYQLASQDIGNVASTGAAPMSTAQVNAAMAAQLAGRSLVAPQPGAAHHRGFFGDIEHAVGSIPGDIGGIITGAPAGIAHLVAHFPSAVTGTSAYLAHTGDTEWLQAHGYKDPHGSWLHHFAADLSNMAHTPLLSLLPGIADVGHLTTGAGREYLLSHPVTAALDVAPAGRIAGLATRGGMALAGVRGAEEGTALEALAAGRPIRATGRAVSAGVQRLSPTTDLRAVAENFTNNIELGDKASAVNRGYNELGTLASRKAQNLMRTLDDLGYSKLSAERRTEIHAESQRLAPLTEENAPFVQAGREIAATLLHGGAEKFTTTKGKDGIFVRAKFGRGQLEFAHDDEAGKFVRQRDKAERLLSTKIRPAQVRALERANKAAVRVDKAQAELDAAAAESQRTLKPYGRERARLQKRLDEAKEAYTKAGRYLSNLEARRKRVQQAAKTARDGYYNALYATGGVAKMRARVGARVRDQMVAARQASHEQYLSALNDPNHPAYDPTTIDARIKEAAKVLDAELFYLKNGSNMQAVHDALVPPESRDLPKAREIGQQLYEDLRRDAVRTELQMISRGLDPLWLHHVDPGREYLAHRVNLLPDHQVNMTQYNQAVFNLSPGVSDIAVGLTAAAREYFREEGTRQYLDEFVLGYAKKTSEMEPQFLKLAHMEEQTRPGRRVATHNLSAHATKLFNDEWKTIRPETFGIADWGGHARFAKGDQLVIPAWLDNTLAKQMPGYRSGLARLPFKSTYDKVLGVWRNSVLVGLRHFVHTAVASLVPMLMDEPLAVRNIFWGPKGWPNALGIIRDIRSGKNLDYSALSSHLFDWTDGTYATAVGKQYRHWAEQAWAKTGARPIERLKRMEEGAVDIYRAATMLEKVRHGADARTAISAAKRVFVQVDDMASWERTIFKHVFPFYAFTRYLFRFLFTYPIDHPYRVAIISQFAAAEQGDWNTGIPEKFMMTLFLGHPDSHGNIKTVDLRNLNPFRSFSNDFTIAGFFSDLTPVAAVPLAMTGFNVLSATGPLYPSLEFNPTTGSLQAAPPGNRAMLGLEQLIPEFGALDHFIGITDQMRLLKKSGNKAAYRAQLFSALNLPGVLSPPVTVNLPYVQERAEMDRYKAAEQAVSQYTEGKTGPETLRNFAYVPYQGQYYTPDQLIAYWQALTAQAPAGINPKALMATPQRRTSQNPLELLAAQQGR